ncbi:hypothetical protein DEU56DRAFT_903183 [Suillus clintonianus]|uniref:uncharacterized protein n=1 Tax=Suillus clintonianus TaxID=1904413 RepID=UPI001B877E4A|nr:uncharacterized protein DEU56DRAFT_903183 [Suillus clintonianus]KAG2127999.1 hypothetical protein DEU56DRAFT_903183 [Suillus clintonianus]
MSRIPPRPGTAQKRMPDTQKEEVSECLFKWGDDIDINLGGYHMSPSSARAINKTLGINDSEYKDGQLEIPINTWLKDNKPDILSGCLTWQFDPLSSRVFFFTHFCDDWVWPEEDEEDLRVKNWLKENGATDMTEWIALWDEYGFTHYGLKPRAMSSDYRNSVPIRQFIDNPWTSPASKLRGNPDKEEKPDYNPDQQD